MFGIPLLAFVCVCVGRGGGQLTRSQLIHHFELYPLKPQDSVNGTLSLMIKRQTPTKANNSI